VKIGIQACIGGFDGRPITLQAILDTECSILVVVGLVNGTVARKRDGVVLISDDRRSDYDMLFNEKDITQALECYRNYKNRTTGEPPVPMLTIKDSAASCNPASVIEPDGMDRSGLKFRMQMLRNEHVALLAICHYAWSGASSTAEQIEMTDMLDRILSGQVVTI
jgi:hypothetical protein